MEKIKFYDKEYDMLDEITCDCGCKFGKDNSIGLVSYSSIELCNIHAPKENIEEIRTQKIRDVKNECSRFIQSKFGGQWTQFNIVNGIGGYSVLDKENYITFINTVLLEEINFLEAILAIQDIEVLKAYSFKFTV